MPRILAIDWDRREARAVVVDFASTRVRVARAVSVALDPHDISGGGVGRRLSKALEGEPVGRARTVVAVGRDHLQLKLLQLPPASAADLPEMVTFQANRELAAAGEEAALDFLPLSGDDSKPHQVLAAVLSRQGIDTARSVCQQIGTDPQRLTVRACSSASLLRRAEKYDPTIVTLQVCPLAEEAELMVLDGGQVILMRTVRLPAADQTAESDDQDGSSTTNSEVDAGLAGSTDASLQGMMAIGLDRRNATLANEIRRTLASSRQQLADRSVEVIFLSDSDIVPKSRNALMQRQLGIPCVGFDPFEVAATEGSLARGMPSDDLSRGRFAATLGLALDEAQGQTPEIDFLNPRRQSDQQTIRRVHWLAGAAAIVVLLGLILTGYRNLAEPAHALARVRADVGELEQVVNRYKRIETQAAEIEEWHATDVNWLDEFDLFGRRMRPATLDSDEFPSDTDAVVTDLRMQPRRGSSAEGGIMIVTAAGRSPSVVAPLEDRLRDERHVVTGMGIEQKDAIEGYPSGFDMEIDVLMTADEGDGDTAP